VKNKMKLFLLTICLCFQVHVFFAIGWTIPATDLFVAERYTGYPKVAIDAVGNAISLWEATISGDRVIMSRRYDATLGWSAGWLDGQNLSGSGQDSQDPQIAMDVLGNAIAVWQAEVGANKIIQACRYVVTTGWCLTATTISESIGNSQDPQVAMDAAGNGIAVWRRNGDIQACRYDISTGWCLTATTISEPGVNSQDPQVAMDPAGNATVVWQAEVGSVKVIKACRYDISTGWCLTVTTISEPGVNSKDPQVVVDPAGNATAVWQAEVGADKIIQACRYDVEAVWPDGWSAVENLSASSEVAKDPQVAMDGLGNAMVVWEIESIDGHFIQVRRYVAAGRWPDGWSTIVNLSDILVLEDQHPVVAMDGAGNAFVVWEAKARRIPIIVAKRYNVAVGWLDGWSAAENLSDMFFDRADFRYPDIAVNVAGNAVVIWEKRERAIDDCFTVQAAAFFEPLSAPTDLKVCKKKYRFSTQIDLINTIFWNSVNGAVKYRIYIDTGLSEIIDPVNLKQDGKKFIKFGEDIAMLVGQIKASTNPLFEHHGRCFGKKVKYYVVAVDKNELNGFAASVII